MLEYEWADADMFFCASTCMTNDLMEQISQKAKAAKKGSWFLTLSKTLPHAETISEENPAREDLHWEIILSVDLKMSWG